jgi:hypothetical protein
MKHSIAGTHFAGSGVKTMAVERKFEVYSTNQPGIQVTQQLLRLTVILHSSDLFESLKECLSDHSCSNRATRGYFLKRSLL